MSGKHVSFFLFLLSSLLLTAGNLSADENGFRPIFDGKTLRGWDGDPGYWTVEEGAITGRTTAERPLSKNNFLVWRQGELDDFELKLKYRIFSGNSGIQYRSREVEKWVVAGYQADIEAGKKWTGALYDERGRGVLAERGQKVTIGADGKREIVRFADPAALLAAIKKEDWNEYTIIARGNHFIHKINGRVTAEVIDNQSDQAERSGILALQIHRGPPMKVQFKDIRLKRLKIRDKKKVVFVAGRPSHGRGAHEHNAGCLLLKHCLDKLPAAINAVYLNGWPKDPTAFDNADTIVLFVDGGGGHPMLRAKGAVETVRKCMARGVGLVLIHYSVEVPKKRLGREFLEWVGGYYETGYSTNPIWTADFTSIPEHPVTRGVRPFKLKDEWYFNIRFRPGMKGVTPLLKAVPPDKVRRTKAAREHPGRAEVVAWCVERSDGGRGFGFTGGHWHKNWGNDDFRKIVLNAILWTAHAEVPRGGVPSKVTPELLEKNLD